ncbi:MAG: GTPase, partial [Chloroflexi bacterium]|nr:GTPase [Chloroflexota bacterium]
NQLTELPPEIGQLSNLTSLVLPYNQLTDLPPEIGQLTNLTSLVLRYNQLTELPPEIGQLTNLTSLYLEGNQLTELSPEIGQLTNLTSLYLEGNQLTELPPEIGQLTNLRRLHLAPNPLRIPPPEIAARGMDDVLDFLRALAEGSAVRREAKMLLVGEGRSGKSSLLRALQGEPFVEGLDTTHGIDVEPYCLPHPNRPGEDVILNVWDFGGQQIYHTTHQFFMTKRSLYVLVWNARGDTDQARLDYWLHNIQVLAPESPVLLVATHIDERPADFNYERFRTAYPQLVGHIGVSNKDGTGIDDLRQIITRRAAELPLMEQQWPITWCDAEEALRGHDGYHITRATYTQICVAQGVRADIAQTVLGGYLHDLGKILYYQDDDLLCDFVILKPNWLTEAISKVLDDDIVRESGGLLPHADFARIWAGYDRSLYPRFLRMMERFLISYQLPSDGPNQEATHSLVPLRLPHNIPPDMRPWPEVLAGQPEINMLFKLQGFTPPGVMSWFIVLTHPYTTGVHWREGVRLEYEGHQAEVVLNPSTHELWLRARGPSPFNFFNILHHTISERVLGFYKGLQYERLVPCNCHLDQDAGAEPCTYLHNYERLAERMEHNKLEVECDRPPFKQVSVPVLLY